MTPFKKILALLASLKVTIVLLLLAMILVFAGTTAQREMGIQDVQRQFFHSILARIELHYFQPVRTALPGHLPSEGFIPGHFYLPGGYALLAAMLVNLLAAHSLRFKFRWKRAGIILIHVGLILLLLGEWATSRLAVESQMQIHEGGWSNFAEDIRFAELAVIDSSSPVHDDVTVIPHAQLAGAVNGEPIRSPLLPFEIKVERWYDNSEVTDRRGPDIEWLATAGKAKDAYGIARVPKVSSAASQEVDQPSAFITLRHKDKSLGTYLVSVSHVAQSIENDGKSYSIRLRFTRYYKPYQVYLKKFTHDVYPGTAIPRDYASTVRLVDAKRNVDREVRIWMNHPLGYGFETLYQQSFSADNKTSTLLIVYNPSWWMPYVACAIGAAGLVVHFGMSLFSFLRRRLAPTTGTAGAKTGAGAAPAIASANGRGPSGDRYTLKPEPAWKVLGVPIAALAVGVSLLASQLGSSAPTMPYDLDGFGQLPISIEGRVQPLDSVARNMLGVVSGGKTSYKDESGKKQPAIQWLLNVMTRSGTWETDKVIRIDHPQVKDLFRLNVDESKFSWKDINADNPKMHEKLDQQVQLALQVPPGQRDSFQHQILELSHHLSIYHRLTQVDLIAWQSEVLKQPGGRETLAQYKAAGPDNQLFLAAPLKPGDTWEPISCAVDHADDMPESAAMFLKIARDYADHNAHDFNNDLALYQSRLRNVPEMRHVGIESGFNRLSPFDLCLSFYVSIFLLGLLSWLFWQKPLWRSGYWMMLLALGVHSVGIAMRIYISGRPPVTNLYSAAVFIGWGIVVFAVAIEAIYRNGIGLVAGSIAGFVSLLVAAGFAAGEGDTMRQLQAVLDTNIWLATHVVCVTLGYMASVFAGVLAILYIVRGLFDHSFAGEASKDNSRMIYGIACFAMLFSFVGTILGGIWADQSWGRFWGWDPKENGAVLVVLWNALILHARWSGIVRERGVAALAVLGNIIVGWSFVGTNLLGIGLHSYGFMSGAQLALVIWCAVNLLVAGCGLIPRHHWRSENRVVT